MPANPHPTRELPPVSDPLLRFFRFVVRGYFRRHFTAVRMRGLRYIAPPPAGPLIVIGSHAGWWDPMTSTLLADIVLPGRRHFAPMDAASLARYPILQRIGIFPVDMQTARGGAQFLRTGEAVLRSGGVLWITPQGRFGDVRERPLVFKPGVASLLARVPEATVLPLAIEYPFWDERLPETLLEWGAPLTALPPDRDRITEVLVAALSATMDSLAAAVQTRDPTHFDRTLLRGRVGTGGFYALGQRLRALLLRRPYRPAHSSFPPEPTRSR